MGAPCMVVGSNLTVAFLERRMFVRLPDLSPRSFVDYFTRNYFRFIDDVVHEWLHDFDINIFSEVLNGLDQDITFELDQLSQNVHYLDVNIKVIEEHIDFDMYYKPTNSFAYLRYNSCHPRHTIGNLSASLARRIVRIVSENRDQRISELVQRVVDRGHPEKVVMDSLAKVMTPHKQQRDGEPITFIRTHNPRHAINLSELRNSIVEPYSEPVKKAFKNKWVLCATRQTTNIRKMLTKAKFILNPPPREPRLKGMFPCGKCTCCTAGHFQATNKFSFTDGNNKRVAWEYTREFTCNPKNVLYILLCLKCHAFYLGKTDDTKQRCRKHASDVLHPHNSNCRECSDHLRDCSGLVKPYFRMYPFFYVEGAALRHFMERRFISRWNPTLNGQ